MFSQEAGGAGSPRPCRKFDGGEEKISAAERIAEEKEKKADARKKGGRSASLDTGENEKVARSRCDHGTQCLRCEAEGRR